MGKNRLEAFSDGVLAIIITIMVLELKVPHDGGNIESLKALVPVLLAYVLSFIYIGIYWNNHYHLLHTVHKISAAVLWANLHLLFWLSLVPFVSGFMGENHFSTLPVVLYGFVLFMSAIAFYILQWAIIITEGENSELKRALGKDIKGKTSIALYFLAIVLAYISAWLACSIYVLVALIWLVPDKRIERVLN